jgi:hypothetical protein
MGYIKEPEGVDLNIGPMPLSDEDRQAVSDIIARYKKTGEVPKSVRKVKARKKKKPATLKGSKVAFPAKEAVNGLKTGK